MPDRGTDMSFARQVETLFLTVRDLPVEERTALLEDRAEDEPDVVAEVRAMLEVPDAAVDALLPEGGATESVASDEQPGQWIGRYELREKIGEGGFGTVWMAEQHEPVRRQVAVKIVKPGMDSQQVLARFESERQALAIMDHPHIAKVLDGGATVSGRPYFVMELVRGVPITSYCDEAGLSIGRRLALFVQVCRAVQHAHGRGIIHRDVKPSNVLVTLRDGEPVPVVIDFGIAKATSAALTQRTLLTGLHQLVGTPEYMAPEQTALAAQDVDTRADVYGLGVLLYELLTGTRPFDLEAAMERGYDEMLRAIREEEPVRPSTRVSTLGETATRVASLRDVGAGALSSSLRGDLDWIVLKALEKERDRRYDTAAGLAADVERFLAHEPVVASPPSRTYQLRKFARRHRGAVAAAGAILLVLFVGLAGTAWGWKESLAAKAEAEAELRRATEIKQFVVGMVTALDPLVVGKADTALLRGILDRTAESLDDGTINDPVVRAELHLVVAAAYRGLGVMAVAAEHAESGRALRAAVLGEEHPDTMAALAQHAVALFWQSEFQRVVPLFERYLAFCRDAFGDRDRRTALATNALGNAYTNVDRYEEAQPLLEEACRVLRGRSPTDLAWTHAALNVALNLMGLDRLGEARARLEEVSAFLEPMLESEPEAPGPSSDPLGPRWPPRVRSLLAVMLEGRLLAAEGKLSEGVALARRALAELEEILGPSHHRVMDARTRLLPMLESLGRIEECLALSRAGYAAAVVILEPHDLHLLEARHRLIRYLLLKVSPENLEEAESLWPEQWRWVERLSPATGVWRNSVTSRSTMLVNRQQSDEAIAFLEQCVARQREYYASTGTCPPYVTLNALGRTYRQVGRPEESLALHQEALDTTRLTLGPTDRNALLSRWQLAETLAVLDRVPEALEHLRQLVRTFEQQGYGFHDPLWGQVRKRLTAIHRQRGRPDDRQRDVEWPAYRASVAEWERGEFPERAMPSASYANGVALQMLTHADPTMRDPAFAVRWARWALALDGGRTSTHLNTYARALFETGDVEAAIEAQKEAVSLLPEGPSEERTALEARLAELQAPRRPSRSRP